MVKIQENYEGVKNMPSAHTLVKNPADAPGSPLSMVAQWSVLRKRLLVINEEFMF